MRTSKAQMSVFATRTIVRRVHGELFRAKGCNARS
jgi:hypothetical protein